MYKVHLQQTGNVIVVSCSVIESVPVWNHSTRSVHLIKIFIASKPQPLQICFQLTVDPKPCLQRSWCSLCYLSENRFSDSARAAGSWMNHSNWFANRFTGLPTGSIEPLNRIDSKEWIIRERASLIAQRQVDGAFGINWSIFNFIIKIK